MSLRAQKGNGWSLEDSQNSWAFSRPGSELGGLTQLAAGSGPASLGKLELGSASFLLLGLSHVYSKASFRASWLPGAGSSPPQRTVLYIARSCHSGYAWHYSWQCQGRRGLPSSTTAEFDRQAQSHSLPVGRSEVGTVGRQLGLQSGGQDWWRRHGPQLEYCGPGRQPGP